jgi:hypothetical protein
VILNNSKGPKYANTIHSKALQNIPNLRFLVCNYTIWQPWSGGRKVEHVRFGRIGGATDEKFLQGFSRPDYSILEPPFFTRIQRRDKIVLGSLFFFRN